MSKLMQDKYYATGPVAGVPQDVEPRFTTTEKQQGRAFDDAIDRMERAEALRLAAEPRAYGKSPVQEFREGTITTLGDDSAARKKTPIFRGVLRYFPAAIAAVSRVSQFGNDKHNLGEDMHHARGKSMDHADCIVRHLVDMDERGGYDENGIPQVAYVAWRALAMCQEWLEEHEGAPLAAGAKVTEGEA